MNEAIQYNEHDEVVKIICASNENRFKVQSNLGTEKFHVAGLFPDILMSQKEPDNTLVFIIEVKKNGAIAQCIQQWKNVPQVPATLYIVVPESDLPNAQSIAQVVGLKTKFGTYTIDSATKKINVKYV